MAAAVIEKHIRVTKKHHRIYDYLNTIPKEALTNEIFHLLSLGVMTMQQGSVAVPNYQASSLTHDSDSQARPVSLEDSIAKELDDFDISGDELFNQFSDN